MFKQSVPLKSYTTFNIGGEAQFFAEIFTKEELQKAVLFADEKNLPLLVLGGGSNVLMDDGLIEAVVIHLNNSEVNIENNKNNVIVSAGAGKNWDEFVEEMVEMGYSGIECLSGIPGTVGAAPIQNIGAYGQEIKDTFHSLEAFDRNTHSFVVFDNSQCNFGYRDSIFKRNENKGRYIVYSVSLKLSKAEHATSNYSSLTGYLQEHSLINPTIRDIRKAVLAIREMKLEDPRKVYNSGSFFKNPVVTSQKLSRLQGLYPDIPNFPFENNFKLSAGWLIDNAGWKGKSYKNVGVSAKHALVLINPTGKGTATEIKELADQIIKDVKTKFGIRLEPEVNYIS